MKKLMLICAPVSSRSGYGDHARDLVRSFIEHNKYDIEILDVPWGECPRNALDNEKDINIISRILKTNQVNRQPDVYVDIRIPNEFQRYGKFNIGITAGIETNAVSNNWIESCNKMDLVLVPSEHSKDGFVKAMYEKMQQLPDGSQQKIGELRLEKPIEVLFEGVDENIYKPIDNLTLDLVDDIKEEFCFLMVGSWLQGEHTFDRKNIGGTLETFLNTFKTQSVKPALILKTQHSSSSILDREDIKKKVEQISSSVKGKLPDVYLLHGDLTDSEMNEMYNHPKVKAHITFTHGEGFGRPLLEASLSEKPVIASNWSGHTDFLPDNKAIMLPGSLTKVPSEAFPENIYVEGSQWFSVNYPVASNTIKDVYDNYKKYKPLGKKLSFENKNKFSLNAMTKEFEKILDKYLPEFEQQVDLKLPQLKPVGKTMSNIKLPTLKKK